MVVSAEHPARITSSVMGSMVWFIGLVVFLFPQVSPVKAAATPKRILALYWYNKDFPSNPAFDRSFQAALKSAPAGSIEYYSEYLESDRFPGENQSEVLRDYLHQKYANRSIDVVVAVSDVPLEFLLKYRDSLFPRTPIVFVAIKPPATNEPSGPGLTGIVLAGGYRKTLDLALRLHPGTKQVFIISGTLNHDKTYETLCREEFQGLDSGISINYFTDLSLDELIFKTRRLPERSLVLYIWQQLQNRGLPLESPDILAAIAPSTTAPIYGVADWQVGRGIVGGYLRTFETEGTRAGEIALRIANGARAQDIPIESATKVPIFDWRELHRWGVGENALPPGSVVLNRQLTLWESSKRYIIGGISLILVETLLIFGLVWQRAKRRKVEAELAVTYERLRLAVEAANAVGWDWDIESGRERWFGDLQTMFGIPSDTYSGNVEDSRRRIHPEDRELVSKAVADARQNQKRYRAEFRVLRPDATLRWIIATGKFYYAANGDAERMLGMAVDITERKASEAAIASLSGRLIDAQEEERKRIAREIHDDYNQRLAMLALNLEELADETGDSAVDVSHRFHDICNRIGELGADLHSLSHSLHSSTLENLGLVAGAKAFCEEFAQQQEIQVDFAHENIPHGVPGDVALCLFRVLQEGLRNIKRHSGADRAEVRLESSGEKLHLSVADRGRGLDVNMRSPRDGIGIRSMEERLRSLGGQLRINSRPMEGTRIDAWVPLKVASERVA